MNSRPSSYFQTMVTAYLRQLVRKPKESLCRFPGTVSGMFFAAVVCCLKILGLRTEVECELQRQERTGRQHPPHYKLKLRKNLILGATRLEVFSRTRYKPEGVRQVLWRNVDWSLSRSLYQFRIHKL